MPALRRRRNRKLLLLTAGLATFLAAAGAVYLHFRSPAVLIQALTDRRPAAGRLAGWGWAPWTPQTAPKLLRPIVRKILSWSATATPRPLFRQDAVAVKNLFEGKPDVAIELWSRAASRNAKDPRLANNLAVALLARGTAKDQLAALDWADQAFRRAPDSPEACFNLALVLETLRLLWEAEKTWGECALREPDTEWRREILRHRRAVTRQLNAVPSRPVKAALGEDLPKWGRLYERGQFDAAEAALTRIRNLGAEQAQRGDNSLADAVTAIDKSTGKERQALARGCRLYGEGWRLYEREGRVAESIPVFAAALVDLQAGVSPLAFWAELWPGAQKFNDRAFEETVDEHSKLASRIDTSRWPSLAGQIDWRIGMAYARQARYAPALQHFRATVSWFERSGEAENRGAAYGLVGETLGLIGEEDEARVLRLRALDLLSEFPRSLRRHVVLRDLVATSLAHGEEQIAHYFSEEDVLLGKHATDPMICLEAYLGRSRRKLRTQEITEARRDLAEAAACAERLSDPGQRQQMRAVIQVARAEMLPPEEGWRALATPLAFYRTERLFLLEMSALVIRTRLAEQAGKPALALSDLRRGLALFESSWSEFQRIADSSRRAYLDNVSTLYETALSLEGRRSGIEALRIAERSRGLLTGEPGGLDLSWIGTLAESSLSSTAGRCAPGALLPSGVVVLELALARDQLYLWLLRCDGMQAVQLAVSRKDLAKRVQRFRKRLDAEDSQALWRLLLQPVAAWIPVGAKLVIVPGPELAHLPFAALSNPETGSYLLEEHEIQLAPSTTFYLSAPPAPQILPGRDLLVIRAGFDQAAYPELPKLQADSLEADGVAALYPGAVVVPPELATKERVLEELDRYRILHLLGHGLPDPVDPSQSLLLVTPDAGRAGSGALAAKELAGRKFRRLELVVLAGCWSVGTERPRGAGLFGLARPFLAGGVSSVVGSFWKVPDTATKELMLALHRHLRTGTSPSTALREAQLEMLRGKSTDLRKPEAWAGFAVVGRAAEHRFQGLRKFSIESVFN